METLERERERKDMSEIHSVNERGYLRLYDSHTKQNPSEVERLQKSRQ